MNWSILRKILYVICKKFAFIIPDKLFININFWCRTGYKMDWNSPKTFCQKIQYLKLLSKSRPEFTQMVDKVDAKLFVASIIGDKYIIPTFGVWNKFEEINFSELPDGFILKCAHDSSKGIVVKEKKYMDVEMMKRKCEKHQNLSYFLQKREYPYKNVPRRLIAEKYLINGNDKELKDYKFYCFNGHAEFCQLIADRTYHESIDFYDRFWNHQPFCGLNPIAKNSSINHIAPANYNEMLSIADKLSTAISWPFVRIDLYNVNGLIFFGEITFFPASGMGKFTPSEWDERLGELISL